MHGFCTSCRRIKLVDVSGSALGRGIPSGECADCTRRKNCRHERTNARTPTQVTVRCSDCDAWGHRDRTGRIRWS